MTTDNPVVLRPLEPSRRADFEAFFAGDAFADNPRWRSCWCQYMHTDHSKVVWRERTGAQNHAAACERIAEGRLQGWLAYREGRVVGWCNAAPRPLFEALADQPDPDAERIGAIACFVVAKPERRRGVARALLAAACDGFRARGLALAEGLAAENAAGEAENHHGPLAMYLAAGFTVAHRFGDGRVLVRRALG